MSNQSRRDFLERSLFAAATAALAANTNVIRADEGAPESKSPNERLRVACVGVRGRGKSHIAGFGKRKDCEIAAIVDVDTNVGQKQVEAIHKKTGKAPAFYQDIRKMLEDKSINIVTIATPNHWHSLAAIWAVQHGKDVYVEKPVSHNVSEGRRVVQAARKHDRIVQSGMQSRSNPGMREAMKFLHSGKLGEVSLARGLCYKPRGSIGPKGEYPVPAGVDYNLWTGPAPLKPLTRKNLHYDWHWMWDYGNGDLGNQGIHEMDKARWGLGVDDIGMSVVSYGGRLGYEDAGQTANTQVCVFEYPHGKRLVFEVRGLRTPRLRSVGVGNIFYGTEGFLVLPSYSGGVAFDLKRNKIKTFSGGGDHFANFVTAVRSRKHTDLNGDILEGHLSSALCHLGNISYRLGEVTPTKNIEKQLYRDDETWETYERFRDHLWYNNVPIADSEDADVIRFGKKLTIDAKNERFTGPSSKEANLMLTREYRSPFVVPAEEAV